MISTWMFWIVISSTGWVVNIDSQDTPSTQWLTMMQVQGVDPLDTYEITLDELRDFEIERADEY